MSNSGPSADQVAAVLLRQQVLARMKIEDPDRFKEYERRRDDETMWGVGGFFIGLLLCAGFLFGLGPFMLDNDPNNVVPVIIILVILFFGTPFLVEAFAAEKIGSKELIESFQNERIKADIQQEKSIETMAKKVDERVAMEIGNTIIVESGGTYIKGGQFTNSFNKYHISNPALADALKAIAGAVELSANQQAAEVFDNLTKEVLSEKPKPSMVRAIWNDLVKILPEVATLAKAATAITGLFSASP